MRDPSHLPGVPGRQRRRRWLLILLAVVALFGPAVSSEADVVLRKRVIRHFPNDLWCPMRGQYDLWFVAATSKATLSITASAGDFDGGSVSVDDVQVVEDWAFAEGFRADLNDYECWDSVGGAPFFHAYGDNPAVPFSESFDDESGWTLVNATIAGGTLNLGIDPDSPVEARVTLTGLKPGTRYFVVGRSSWSFGPEFQGNAGFTVTIDNPRPPALFLQNGRFKLEARYDGPQLAGGQVLTEKSAVLWFRDPLKTELIVNVNDRCQDKGKYHVQVGGTTATRMSIVITDLQTGKSVRYENRQGARFQTKIDEKTFQCRQ